MSFEGLKRRTSERFNEVQVLLNFINSSEPRTPSEPVSLEVKIMKGLFYVHLYAAFEKSIKDIVETALLLISSKSIKNNHFAPALLSLVLSDKIKSLKDSGYSKLFIKSAEIFKESTSNNVVPINETIFSGQLQNAWVKTILEISEILGMEEVCFEPRIKTTIDEIVDKRNAVAHGRDSAAFIGERHRANILREKMELISSAIQQFINEVEQHCDRRRYIKPALRRHYK